MKFPIQLKLEIDRDEGVINRDICIYSGLTTILGPNGSGKTHFLRGFQAGFQAMLYEKKIDKEVRFLSAGRMGGIEQHRSNFHGYGINYNDVYFGHKSDAERRYKIETLNGDYQILSQRPDILMKVKERLQKLFKRELLVEWDNGLQVFFRKLGSDSKTYSSAKEASGLIHLVGILAALYDDEIGVLLIDEPEVSLHPQLQSFLFKEIIEASGGLDEGGYKKIIILATHSMEMLRLKAVEDLSSLIFCSDLDKKPIQISPNDNYLKSKKLRDVINTFSHGYKRSLFSNRPLLVEGPSDEIIVTYLSNRLELYLEASGVQLLPVLGKGELPVVVNFMRAIGKKPIVLADADTFIDDKKLIDCFLGNSIEADSLSSRKYGVSSAKKFATDNYSVFCDLIESSFEDFSDRAKKHPYYLSDTENEILKRRRSVFCILMTLTDDEINQLSNADKWRDIKNCLVNVLDLLEEMGCFILRKGEIESYYLSDNVDFIDNKPASAVDEVTFMNEVSREQVQDKYSDIYRCIKHASENESIDEAIILKELLLAILAPIKYRIDSDLPVTNQDIELLARDILGDRSSIFSYIVGNDTLTIDLNSNIMNVEGFPLVFKKREDIFSIANRLRAKY